MSRGPRTVQKEGGVWCCHTMQNRATQSTEWIIVIAKKNQRKTEHEVQNNNAITVNFTQINKTKYCNRHKHTYLYIQAGTDSGKK